MSQAVLILSAILSLIGAHARAGEDHAAVRLNKNGLALCEDRDSASDADCYDPVSYFIDNRAEKVGVEAGRKFRAKYENATYVFKSQEHLDQFNRDPKKYTPSYGGWCAYAVAAKSEKVDIDPKSFRIQDGRLLLFYDGIFADTRKTWTTDAKKDPATYLREADANWPKVVNLDP